VTGLLLRLAGPMQSWGEHSSFSQRDTGRFPTRSGLIGLIACALGRRRTDPVDDLAALRFTIRVDRHGEMMEDFHTVGGGMPPHLTVPTAEGGRRKPATATIVSRRHYLADAVFVVAVEGPSELVTQIASALRSPAWAPYLGRRSCPAEAPLLVRERVEDPVDELRRTVPLCRRPPRKGDPDVTFVHEHGGAGRERLDLNDSPISFDPLRRRYVGRPAYVETERLPAQLCAGLGVPYLKALKEYLDQREGRSP